MVSPEDILHARILIVDDLEANVLLLEQMLRDAGYLCITSTRDPRAVCALHGENHYDLILLDLRMPGMDGFQVMAGLKEIEKDGYLPVLAVTAEPAHTLRALQSGAKDFVGKPLDLAEVLMRVRNLLEVRLLHEAANDYGKMLESLALNDPLTGLANRRLLTDRMAMALVHAHRDKSAMAVLFLDLDGFKGINDTLGHGVGDILLKMVAERLEATVREEDTVARCGGDEFILALWHVSGTDYAAMVALRAIEAVSQPYLIQGVSVSITTSVGISVYPDHGEDGETLMKSADSALYEAKRSGKNAYRIATGRELPGVMLGTKAETSPAGTLLSLRTEEGSALIHSELRYRRLFEAAQDGILILNAETGAISDVNPFLIDMLGYSREEFLGKSLWEVGAFKDINASRSSFSALQEHEFIRYENLPLKSKDGRLIQVEFVSNVYLVGDEKVIQCNVRDISARKEAEAELRAKEVSHGTLVEHLPVGVVVHLPDTRIILGNPEASRLLGISVAQMLGKDAGDPLWFFVREDGIRMSPEEFPANQVIVTGQPLKNFIMGIARDNGGKITWVLVNAYPEFSGSAHLRQVVVTFADISEINSSEKKIKRQLEQLTALVEIDRAINFSFDLKFSLTTLLTHLLLLLGVDAADVLIFNPATRMLEYVTGRGFSSETKGHAPQPLGEGYAGRAAEERRIVHIPDLGTELDGFLRGVLAAGEEFVSYHGVPLLAKGEIVGVLELFHRSRVVRDEEWLEFLTALASQAAIALNNVTLFDNLQRSNAELFHAYDATIEGWSRSLELRDKETEGHTQRAALLSVKLARLFDLSEAELVQVRWGALLHDIGKMGIPDSILLKQGALTEAEWIVMKHHPVFACEMLSPIRYLRLALDIPTAHHEKWDGTGYPHGLKGEKIPLVARIFAVADVWDALRSHRPYHDSWSVEKVREHLRSLAGTHFDPEVVLTCLASNILLEKPEN